MWRKYRKYLAAAGFAVVLLAAGFWGVASAQSFKTGNSVDVAPDEVVDSSMWATGRSLDIAGEVNGDVFCAGQNVTVSGTIRGDLLCAAQNITISGTITGDVRTASQTLTLSGSVFGNMSVLSQSYNQGSDGSVRGDLSTASGDMVVNGPVGRDAALTGSSIILGGEVGRNVKASTGQIELKRTADIGGNLEYNSHNDVRIANGATVAGEVTKTEPKEDAAKDNRPLAGLGFFLYMLAAGLLVALVLVLFFPQAFHSVTSQGLNRPGWSLLAGLVAAVTVPILIILLMMTVIGIPLALLLLAAWMLIVALAGVVSAYFLGRLLWRRQRNPVFIMLLGAAVLLVLYIIPIAGFIFFLAAILLGLGMMVLEFGHRRPKPKYNLPPR